MGTQSANTRAPGGRLAVGSNLIEDAVSLALWAHAGQQDKAGAPYILHAMRVASRMESQESIITALLHDTIEDSDLTLDELRQRGYPQPVLAALECLTKRDDEVYDDYLERVRANELARRVKLADLADNVNLARIEKPSQADHERLTKYERAIDFLSAPGSGR